MIRQPVVIAGFVPLLASIDHFTDHSVILIEEPDTVRRRGVRAALAGRPMVRDIVEWEYLAPGAADRFADAYPGLDPEMVFPLVEYATPFAARLAERYGRPGAGGRAARIMRDKSELRAVTRAAGVPNPRSGPVRSPAEVRAFLAAYPGAIVLKPANRQASLGTLVLTDPAQVDAAWAECTAMDEGGLVPERSLPLRMLAEQYLHGPEYSVEMLVRDGVPVFTNITAKSLYPGPHPVEAGHVVPADLPAGAADALRDSTVRVLRATGFGTGIVHCEWILHGGVPYLVECAGRFPGDGIAELIERAYPIPLIQHYYTVMRGGRPSCVTDRAEGAAAVRFLKAEPGVVTAIEGVAEAEALPGVVRVSLAVRPGDRVRALRSSWDRVGSVLVHAADPGEAEKQAVIAADRVRIHVRRVGSASGDRA